MDNIPDDSLFCTDNLEHISILLQNNQDFLNAHEIYNTAGLKMGELSEYFEETLSEDDKKKFDELQDHFYKISECECFLAFQIGLKRRTSIKRHTS